MVSISPKQALLEEYALVATALSAPARLAILEQLAQKEHGVDSLAARTGLTLANCSQHLKVLRRAGLVASQRAGKAVIYRLSDPSAFGLMAGLRQIAERNLAEVERILRGLSGGETPPEPVSRAELAERISAGEVTVIDLRPADEFAVGHLPGAINLRLSELADAHLDGEIVAYCRGPFCLDSQQAETLLRARGLQARRMDGGLPEWREEGRMIQVK
jgi:rhodanese-related sulfurtransferase/DNA-binding transcriptional ArsR family regulator